MYATRIVCMAKNETEMGQDKASCTNAGDDGYLGYTPNRSLRADQILILELTLKPHSFNKWYTRSYNI
jgi:hypothetical protein